MSSEELGPSLDGDRGWRRANNRGSAVVDMGDRGGTRGGSGVGAPVWKSSVEHTPCVAWPLYVATCSWWCSTSSMKAIRSGNTDEKRVELFLIFSVCRGSIKFSSASLDDSGTRTPPSVQTDPNLQQCPSLRGRQGRGPNGSGSPADRSAEARTVFDIFSLFSSALALCSRCLGVVSYSFLFPSSWYSLVLYTSVHERRYIYLL